MKQLSYAVIFAVIGGVVYMGLNQENKMVRKFEFTYQVDLVDDPNSEETMKAWIPVPQSIDNVQTVSNHRIDYNKNELECNELTEGVHKNKYYFSKNYHFMFKL